MSIKWENKSGWVAKLVVQHTGLPSKHPHISVEVRKVFESSMVRLRPVSVFTKVGPGTLTGPERVRDAERTH